MLGDPTAVQIVRFLTGIGLNVIERELVQDTFLPGLTIENGALVVDPSRLKYPGDLLHEAGHLALLDAEQRQAAGSDMGRDGGFEMGAIAWSYAAALHIGIDPKVVFHEHGYRGGSKDLLENFGLGYYVGVPMLQWLGMAAGPQSAGNGDAIYPKMMRWLRP